MRVATWLNLTLVVGAIGVTSANGQTYPLIETPTDGDGFRVTTSTQVTGSLKVTRDGKPVALKIDGKNEHVFLERALAAERGLTRKAARYYQTAASHATVDGQRSERALAADRRLIVAQRVGDGLFCYSPVGPLTRPDLEVVSEHFETLHLAGLLPGKDVAVGDAWKIENIPAQSLCLFDGLITHDLTGRLKEVTGGTAVIAVQGTAQGVENGALAKLTVSANVHFDLGAKRIVGLEWRQRDVRDQGPVSPAADVETVTTLKRESLPQRPAELSDASLAAIATTDEPAATLKQLVHRDPNGRYQFLHSRDWHIVGQTDHHLVMRLLDRGDFVTQATLTPWTNAGPGKHLSPEEFEKLAAGGSNWKMEQVTDRTAVPTDADRWVYRISARGELDGSPVVQNFYVVATANGDQMIVTFTMRPAAAGRLGTRDLELVNALDFPKK
jgi:hypothetical protein